MWLPHRLDKWTSGLLVVALKKSAIVNLNKSIAQGRWRKEYRLIVQTDRDRVKDRSKYINGRFFNDDGTFCKEGEITSFIARRDDGFRPPQFKKLRHQFLQHNTMMFESVPDMPQCNGRSAVTHFTYIRSNKTLALYHAKLITGRTHQLRVHFSDMGCPIYGDPYYNDQFHHTVDRLHTQKPYMFLQAFKLSFPCPTTNGTIVELDLPLEGQWDDLLK